MRNNNQRLRPRTDVLVRVRCRRAFSMIETTVSILLVSILLVGSLNTLAFTTATSTRDLDGLKAACYAEQLFAELSGMHFIDPSEPTTTLGREASETNAVVRTNWDDVDDYHGLNEATLKYRDGTTIPNTSGWIRAVSIESLVPSTLSTTTSIAEPLRRITVTLERSGRRTYTFQFLVSRDGFRTPNDLAPTVQPCMETEWQIGTRYYTWGVPLRNLPLAPVPLPLRNLPLAPVPLPPLPQKK